MARVPETDVSRTLRMPFPLQWEQSFPTPISRGILERSRPLHLSSSGSPSGYCLSSTGILLIRRSSVASETLDLSTASLNLPRNTMSQIVPSGQRERWQVGGLVDGPVSNFLTRALFGLELANLESSMARAAARDSGEPSS